MIVNAAGLADLPTDGHALEDVVLENEVAGVVALGEKEIFVERFGPDCVADDVVLHVLQSELRLRDGGETCHPIGDGELIRGQLLLHSAPPNGNPEIRGIAKEL